MSIREGGAAKWPLWTWIISAAMIGSMVFLASGKRHPIDPSSTNGSESGTIIGAEVSAIWVPRSLVDVADQGVDAEVIRERLEDRGWKPAWYAITCLEHRADGRPEEITRLRRLGGDGFKADEFRAVMATIAGSPTNLGFLDFSRARIELIPDSMKGVEPREAIGLLSRGPGDE